MSWHISNIRDVEWSDAGEFGVFGHFEQDEHFPEFGVNFGTVWPGQPTALYHRESNQEGFLVLSGECLAIVEGEEHPLKAWDYFHCPAGVDHIIVGAGDGPSFVLAIGGRLGPREIVYPVDETALRHNAGVTEEVTSSDEAYARFPQPVPIPFREEFLPG